MNAALKEPHPKEYLEVINSWKNQINFTLPGDQGSPLLSNPALLVFFNQAPFASYIFDISSQEFVFVSDNIKELFGHHAEAFLKGGLRFKNAIVHEEDLVSIWKFFKIYWKNIYDVPSVDRMKYRFSFDFRITKPNGEEARILEQVTILQQDLVGNITHILGSCIDITCWKKSGDQFALITSSIDNKATILKPEEGKTIKSQLILSRREVEIVKLLSQGCSSKFIADKLHISFNTVNTHRQHIIRKTNTKNTGELIQFAASCGII